MKILLPILLLSICESKCPKGWANGQWKCLKFVPAKKKLQDAIKICKKMGGRIFTPDTEREYNSIKELAGRRKLGKLNWSKNFFWIGGKLKKPKRKSYDVMSLKQGKGDIESGLLWIEDSHFDSKSKYDIRSGNRKNKDLLISNNGKFLINGRPRKGAKRATRDSRFVAPLCEKEKLRGPPPNPKECWQPYSDLYDSVTYTGDISYTNMNYDCMPWDQAQPKNESMKPLIAEYGSKNYCRNPDNGESGPWCYVDDPEQRWDYCPVDICDGGRTEFDKAQLDCGRRPIINNQDGMRIIGGRDAKEGETPYQIRLRYKQKIQIAGILTDHQCGGTIVSSCYILTGAHCIQPAMDLQDWFRVDVGNRHKHNMDGASGDEVENQQTLRVNKVFVHENYNDRKEPPTNDLALVQLYPSREDGQCIIFNEYAQPACINREGGRFKEDDECLISGWGDVDIADDNYEGANMLQVAKVKIDNFEDCEESYQTQRKWIAEKNHLCAHAPGVDSCQGDSGGPLMCIDKTTENIRAYLVGVTSFGIGCASEKFPGIYVPVSSYYGWINDNVRKHPVPDYNPQFTCQDPDCNN